MRRRRQGVHLHLFQLPAGGAQGLDRNRERGVGLETAHREARAVRVSSIADCPSGGRSPPTRALLRARAAASDRPHQRAARAERHLARLTSDDVDERRLCVRESDRRLTQQPADLRRDRRVKDANLDADGAGSKRTQRARGRQVTREECADGPPGSSLVSFRSSGESSFSPQNRAKAELSVPGQTCTSGATAPGRQRT